MSQYASSITGDVIVNLRGYDNKIINISPYRSKGTYIYNQGSGSSITLENNGKYSPHSLKLNLTKSYTQNQVGINIIPHDISNVYTVSFWCKITGFPTTATSSGQHMYAGYALRHRTDNSTIISAYNYKTDACDANARYNQLHIASSGSNVTYGSDHNTLRMTNASNTWIHYGCVFNNGTAKIYKNGTLLMTHTSNNLKVPSGSKVGNILMVLTNQTSQNINCSFQFDDLVIIDKQQLWTSNFTVPNSYLTGAYNFSNTKRIWGTSLIWPRNDNNDYFDKAYLY